MTGTDAFDDFETLWTDAAVSMMLNGRVVAFRVIEDEWNADYAVRTIKRIEVVTE